MNDLDFLEDNDKKKAPLWVTICFLLSAVAVLILFINFILSLFTVEDYDINDIPLIKADSLVIKKYIDNEPVGNKKTLSIYNEL
ncbi:MAG: hypothetical protein LBC92_03305, partial [Rickettsiales bacterium]|nr:hypothetical protein [Rickettsiales bacterium]